MSSTLFIGGAVVVVALLCSSSSAAAAYNFDFSSNTSGPVKDFSSERNNEDLEFAVLCYEDCAFKNITSNDVIKFKKGELTKTLFNTINVKISSKEDPTKKFRSMETRNMIVTGTYFVQGSTTPQTIKIGTNEKLIFCDPGSISNLDLTCKPAVFK